MISSWLFLRVTSEINHINQQVNKNNMESCFLSYQPQMERERLGSLSEREREREREGLGSMFCERDLFGKILEWKREKITDLWRDNFALRTEKDASLFFRLIDQPHESPSPCYSCFLLLPYLILSSFVQLSIFTPFFLLRTDLFRTEFI